MTTKKCAQKIRKSGFFGMGCAIKVFINREWKIFMGILINNTIFGIRYLLIFQTNLKWKMKNALLLKAFDINIV